jgi:hypothetical protein
LRAMVMKMAPRSTPAAPSRTSSSRLTGGEDGAALRAGSLLAGVVVLAVADGAGLYAGGPDVVVIGRQLRASPCSRMHVCVSWEERER